MGDILHSINRFHFIIIHIYIYFLYFIIKKFSIYAKKLFLTFPNVNDPNINLQYIKNKLETHHYSKTLEYAIIAKEKHENNIPHYHLLLVFKKKHRIRNPNFFDFLCDKHGNYQTCRNVNKSIQYITKDRDYITIGDIPLNNQNQQYREQLITILKDPDYTPSKIFNLNDNQLELILYQDSTKVDHFCKKFKAHHLYNQIVDNLYVEQFNIERLNDTPSHLIPYINQVRPIFEFLNKYMNQRHYKSPNLLLYSAEANRGKSSILNLLKQNARCYL